MNINDFLENSSAIDFGNYYIVICPVCKHREAYIYKGDIERYSTNTKYKIPIRCNREKNCGETSFVEESLVITNEDKKIIKEKAFKAASAKNITVIGKNWLSDLVYFADRLPKYDMDIRGIKNLTLKKYKICYLNEGWEKTITRRKQEFGDTLFKGSYIGRDLLFPIFNLEGRLDRILLRSYDKELEKKEIQIKMYDDAIDGFNLLALKNDNVKNIVFTEGIYDALSVIESINQEDTEAIGIPGVKKWKGIIDIMNSIPNAKDKNYIIAFDNDEAGLKNTDKFQEELKKNGYKVFTYKILKYKDLNEFYLAEPKLLGNALRKYLRYLSK